MVGLKLGVLGGTFDPPHVGHLVLAEYALESLGLSQVLFAPAGDPPHKPGMTRTPTEQRLAMARLAIAGEARFILSTIDIDRPGPHYTVDMLRLLQAQFPDAELYFLMGADSFRDLPKWYHPADIIPLCQIVVANRCDVEVVPEMHEATLPGLAAKTIMLDIPLVAASSTEIATRLRAGKSVRYLVPQPVLDYIASDGLYR
jgi:nicotinate-nucleotide adenylyltransferase